MPNGGIEQNSLLLNRPLSDNGLPIGLSGNINIIGDGSSTPIDYYVEALEGERLAVARAIIHIVASGAVDSDKYGNLSALTNGIQLFYRRSGVLLDVSNGLPIKTNVGWGRWCFDAAPVIFSVGVAGVFQARWSFAKYGNPLGIVLEEGDRLGIRVNDNLSGLAEQTIVLEGVHLGIQNPQWTLILS